MIPNEARLGWTSTSITTNPLRFDYHQSASVYFRVLPIGNDSQISLPVVGETYDFQALPFPAIFSVAVVIDTCKS